MANIVAGTIEVCVFKHDGDVTKYLLLKRSENEALYPGMWQLVTGTIKDGEFAVQAALREFKEETGMEALRFWVAPHVNSFYLPSSDTVHLSPFFAVEVAAQGQVLLSREHQEYQWCTYADAAAKLVWPGQRHGLQLVHEYIVGGQEASRLLSLSI